MDKAQTLLRLATGGVLTEGRVSARARELILGCLSEPGFLTGYMAVQTREAQTRDEPVPNSEQMMADLMDQLGKAGITAETG